MDLCRKKTAEFSEEEAYFSPDDLLKEAETEPAKPEFVLAKDYVHSIHKLREKGFCWTEIVAWFRLKGVPYSLGSIRRVYRIIYEGNRFRILNQ